jgi:hypothetical protein
MSLVRAVGGAGKGCRSGLRPIFSPQLVSLVCGAALPAAACGLLPDNSAAKVTIPDTYKTSDKAYTTGADASFWRTSTRLLPWSQWTWVRPKPFATIVNGSRRGFSFEDSDVASETSLGRDGIWLYASSVYEDYLNAGKRPDPASALTVTKPAAARGAYVGRTRAVESGGDLQFRVTIVRPDSNPLPAAMVTLAWSGPALPDVAPEQAVRMASCDTDAGGSCAVTLAPAELPVHRPITVAVINVEHPLVVYDLAADVAQRTATFP